MTLLVNLIHVWYLKYQIYKFDVLCYFQENYSYVELLLKYNELKIFSSITICSKIVYLIYNLLRMIILNPQTAVFYNFCFFHREISRTDAKLSWNSRNPISRTVFATLSIAIYGFCERSSTALPKLKYLYGLTCKP